MDRTARIDLHKHSFFSDGDLARCGGLLGYEAPAITDHADASNPDQLVAQLLRFASDGPGRRVALRAGLGEDEVRAALVTHARELPAEALGRTPRQL